MKDFYQVQMALDHGWSASTDVLASTARQAAHEELKGLAEDDSEWCSDEHNLEWHNLRVRRGGGEWEHFKLRAKMQIMIEDYADKKPQNISVETP